MSNGEQNKLGAVISMWRYPVKSMMGEELNIAQITNYGLFGDRAYALLDNSNGKVVTAKNPRKWPELFAYRAAFMEPANGSDKIPAVRITLPNGSTVTSEQNDINQTLSKALDREVTFAVTERGQVAGVRSSVPASWAANAEEYWPDMEGLDHRDTVTDFELPTGTFFDCATVHLLTTATIDRLRELYPQGRFEVRRFRPNIVVNAGDENGFTENGWIGHTLAIGDQVQLNITGPCPRCVMTTLPQGDIPKDSGILRTAVQQNQGNVGVYAAVVKGGTIHRGDQVRFED